MKILVTEDNFVDRKILCNFLQKHGDVDVAANGVEMVEAIQFAIKENDPYKLICLDVNMPKMNGFDALCAIRGHEEELDIQADQQAKVIMTTGLEDAKTLFTSFSRQCDAFIHKPITRQKIEDEMKKLHLI